MTIHVSSGNLDVRVTSRDSSLWALKDAILTPAEAKKAARIMDIKHCYVAFVVAERLHFRGHVSLTQSHHGGYIWYFSSTDYREVK